LFVQPRQIVIGLFFLLQAATNWSIRVEVRSKLIAVQGIGDVAPHCVATDDGIIGLAPFLGQLFLF